MSTTSWVVEPVEPFLGSLKAHTFRLGNGLRLVVVPDASAPVVAYHTWYGVGAGDEARGHTGLAHLFEHMMFKGTEGYDDGEYMRRLDALGADGLNAWTWLDQTVFLQAVPTPALPELARLEALRMAKLVVDDKAFASELDVVINERRLTVDDSPEGRLSELLFKTAFVEHPYGSPTIGWMKDLECMEPEHAREFYARWYAPDNATIILVGDVQPEQAVALIDGAYGELAPAGTARPERAVEPPQREQRRGELTLPIAADRVLVGAKIPAYSHPDTPALLVLDAALTAGSSSRLGRRLRDRGVVADVGSFVMPLRDPSLWQFVLAGRPGVGADIAEAALLEALAEVREHGVTEAELRMAKAQWESSTWASLEDAMGKADLLGWALTHTGKLRDGVERIEAIERVTLDQVRSVAASALNPDGFTIVTGRASEPAPAVEVPAPATQQAPGVQTVSARGRGRPSTLPRGELQRLSHGGAELLLAHDDTVPLMHLRLYLPRGAATDPAGAEGLCHLGAHALLRGTAERTRPQFEDALEQLGANISVAVDGDGLLLSVMGLASTMPQVTALLSEALSQPRFDKVDVVDLKREIGDALASLRDDDAELVALVGRRALYGAEHPYGLDPRGSASSLATLSTDSLSRWHRSMSATGAVLGLAGDLDHRAVNDMRDLLAALPGSAEPVMVPTPAPHGPVLIVVDKPERGQAQVLMGCTGIDQRDPAFADLVLLNDVFGVGFEGRLMQAIRVKRGWSYYANSYPAMGATDTSWHISMAPAHEHAVEAVATVRDMLQSLHRDGPTVAELEQMRLARRNGLPFVQDTTRKRLDLAIQQSILGYDRHAATERMMHTDPAAATAAFRRWVDPGRMVVAVVGMAEQIVPGLEDALGMKAQVVDWTEF